jgi:hypothetical protein
VNSKRVIIRVICYVSRLKILKPLQLVVFRHSSSVHPLSTQRTSVQWVPQHPRALHHRAMFNSKSFPLKSIHNARRPTNAFRAGAVFDLGGPKRKESPLKFMPESNDLHKLQSHQCIIPHSSPTDFDSDSDTAPVSVIEYRNAYTHQHPPSPETLAIQVVVIATQQ